MSEVIDTTAVEVGTELVPAPQPPTTLFRTDDPVEVVEQASRVADALKRVIVSRRLAKNIQGRDHVLVEGWTTLGSMLGVVPVVEWSRPVDGSERRYTRREKVNNNWEQVERKGSDWEARVTARTLDGRVIGAAEATCSREEGTWSERDDYALRSMAQTRATSKALRGPLGFVVTLAGYAATPAEEMPDGAGGGPPELATMPQRKFLKSLITKNRLNAEVMVTLLKGVGVSLELGDDPTRALNDAIAALNKGQCSTLIETIQDGAVPDPERPSDVPDAAGDEFVHPQVAPDDLLGPS